jgi:hypothetical protein
MRIALARVMLVQHTQGQHSRFSNAPDLTLALLPLTIERIAN